jgi:3-oxoacyl-[acyl-carrier-protein] synthase III
MKGGRIAIIGVGETPFLRKGEETVLQMMARASLAAIADAGLTPKDIDGYIGNSYAHHGSDEVARAIGAGERMA